MSQDFERLDFKSGDELSARDLQALKDAILPGIAIRGGAGMSVRRSLRGDVAIALVGQGPHARVAVVTTLITARVVNTPGTGNVDLKSLDSTTGDMVTIDSITGVRSFSSTVGGLAIGTWGFVTWDDDGVPWFSSADCG